MSGSWKRWALLAGTICFGFILPDSTSDHTKLVHFAAHMGMSFLVACFSYVICTLILRIRKSASLTLLIGVTLVVGGIYKYFEIASMGLLQAYPLGPLLKATGCYTSMSQNISGLLAAILLIELISSGAHLLYHALAPGSLLSKAEVPFHPVRRQTGIPRA